MNEEHEKYVVMNILDIFDVPEDIQNRFWTLLDDFTPTNKWGFITTMCHAIYDNHGYWAIGIDEAEKDLSTSYEVLDLLDGHLFEVYEFTFDELMANDKARWEITLISKE